MRGSGKSSTYRGLVMNGLKSARSSMNVPATVEALRRCIDEQGATVFAVIDHGAAAAQGDLRLPATQLVIFGRPLTGTALLQDCPQLAIDLPLRILIRDDGATGAVVTWQDPEFVARRFGLTAEESRPLHAAGEVVSAVLQQPVSAY